MAHRSVSSRWRALSLVLIGLVAGTLLLGTAGAHVTTPGHLWKQHIKPKADKRYLRQTKTWVVEDTLTNGAGQQRITTVNCPSGWEALGGGVHFVSNHPDVRVTWNGPLIDGDNIVAASPGKNPAATGWKIEMENLVNVTYNYSVGVICSRAA